MKLSVRILCAVLLVTGYIACTGKKASSMPENPPDKVILHFYELLKDGSKMANREAHNMVSTKYRALDPDDFRKWTDTYNKDSIVVIKETNVAASPNEAGDYVASVVLEAQTPSSFGGSFSTTSTINLILDTDSNEWKIDFMADSIDESDYMKAPAEANPPDGDKQGQKNDK